MTKEAMKLAKSTGLIERLYYKGTTPEDTDAILRFFDAGLAHAKAVCVSVCEQTDEDGEGPDQWDWHAKDYASALREALDHIANGGKMIEQPAQQQPVQYKCMVIDNHHQNAIPFEQWVKPPQRTWVGLTNEERKELWAEGHSDYAIDAIEAKLKEKNT